MSGSRPCKTRDSNGTVCSRRFCRGEPVFFVDLAIAQPLEALRLEMVTRRHRVDKTNSCPAAQPRSKWRDMNPVVSKVHAKEKRWSAEFAALRRLCLAPGLN